jgi:hypothetical protein
VPLAYLGALIAAGSTIAVGFFGPTADLDTSGYFVASALVFTFYAGALSFVPATVVVVFSEAFAWRSIFLWLALGGTNGLTAHEFIPEFIIPDMSERQLVMFLGAGFVGGFVYWLIAGRYAGGARATSPR